LEQWDLAGTLSGQNAGSMGCGGCLFDADVEDDVEKSEVIVIVVVLVDE
jgi:hypothetical protein